MYRLIVLGMLLLSLSSSAQMSYQEANEQSYSAFTAENWEEVISITRKAKDAGHDFYYLNIRCAIAHYQLKNYYASIDLLKKLLVGNPADQTALQYQEWNYLSIGDAQLAHTFSEKTKVLSAIELNTGSLLFPRSIGNPLGYFNTSLKFNIIPKTSTTITYNSLKQNTNWGDYQQHQVFLGNTWMVSKKYRFTLNYHFIGIEGDMNHQYSTSSSFDSTAFTPQGPTQFTKTIESNFKTTGTIAQNQHIIFTGLEKRVKRNTYQFGLGTRIIIDNNSLFQTENTSSTVTQSNSSNSTTAEKNTSEFLSNYLYSLYQIEFGGIYHSRQLNNSIWYNYKMAIPWYKGSVGLSLQTGITAAIHNKWILNGNLLYNSKYNAIEQAGASINNGLDLINFRLGASAQYKLNSLLQLKSSVQYSFRTEYYESTHYQSPSFNLGILFTL